MKVLSENKQVKEPYLSRLVSMLTYTSIDYSIKPRAYFWRIVTLSDSWPT